MKLKLHLFYLMIFFAVPVFSQTTAYSVQNISQCDNPVFDLTQQTTVVLGNQNPLTFAVDYFTTLSEAQGNINAIANPTAFTITATQTIFIRVTNIADLTYATTSFQVEWNMTPQISVVNTYSCEYFLPPLLEGSYHTGPGGTGTLLHAGDQIYYTQTIYVLAGNGNCTAEQSFIVVILYPTTPITLAACNSYTLTDSGSNGAATTYYSNNSMSGAPIPVGTIFTTSTTIYGYNMLWCDAQEINLIIGTIPVNAPTALYGCDSDDDGFALFNLNLKTTEITGNVGGLSVSYYESDADAQSGINALQSPYTNTVQNGQIVYARIQTTTGNCFEVTPLQLALQPCGSISGVVRFDADQNGCTASDASVSGIPISLSVGNYSRYAYTDTQGQYAFDNVPNGYHLVKSYPEVSQNASPASGYNLTVAGISAQTADFCITPAAQVDNAAVFLYTNGNARPSAPVSYILACSNFGNTILSGTITLQFDNGKLNFASANPAQTTVVGNVVSFDFGSLLPFQTVYYTVQFNVMQPPIANLGDVLHFDAAVGINATDVVPINNTAILNQVIVNSLDPNDITVAQGATIVPEQISQDLVYTIHFQNLGNAAAENVRVENTLDADLDWSTFRPVSASHSYTVERINAKLTFRFNGINLAAASTNEAMSSGDVTYRIKPIGNLAFGDLIENNAQIYFDFNAPIATNTVTTELVATLQVAENESQNFTIYPNPTSGKFTVSFAGVLNDVVSVRLFDLQGKLIFDDDNVLLQDNHAFVDISKVQPGMYFVRIEHGGKSTTKKLFVK